LILAGVGVVPVALLATLTHADWYSLLNVVLGIFLTLGTRILGMYLSERRPVGEEVPG